MNRVDLDGEQVTIHIDPNPHMPEGATLHMCLTCMLGMWHAMAAVLVKTGYIEPVTDGDEEPETETRH